MRWYVVSVVAMFVAGVAFVPFARTYDDGLPEISVTVHSIAGHPIKAMSAEGFLNVENAREMLAGSLSPFYTRAEKSIYSAAHVPFVDEPLKVKIPSSHTSYRSLLWTYRIHFQYRGLMVVVEYEDGKRQGRAVEIPDLRGGHDRELAIEVP